MSVSKPLDYETEVPLYQLEAIEWLEGYRNATPLQDLLRRCKFSKEEIEAYRSTWVKWLKPKASEKRRMGWRR